jgi:hypothetical protein
VTRVCGGLGTAPAARCATSRPMRVGTIRSGEALAAALAALCGLRCAVRLSCTEGSVRHGF